MAVLNFHHLRYFWMVAREGSVRRAAERLHVSQPTVSAQVRALEDALGVKLFRKSGRGLLLTEAGERARRYGDEIFTLGDQLQASLRQPGEQVGGEPLEADHLGRRGQVERRADERVAQVLGE